MELIDKQKEGQTNEPTLWAVCENDEGMIFIKDNKGRLVGMISKCWISDHSTQEEIANLKEEKERLEMLYTDCDGVSKQLYKQVRSLDARAIQAEQERDEWKYTTTEWTDRAIKAEDQRNALLEGLKDVYEHRKSISEIGSIIAKIEST